MARIAIIGSGMTGLSVARHLESEAVVKIFDKSRGVGGRISTRRAGDYHFDHGAQFFIARTKSFQKFIQPMIGMGMIKRWDARFCEFDGPNKMRTSEWDAYHPHYVGAPSMSVIGQYLSKDLDIALNTKVVRVEKNKKWLLFDEDDNELGEFDWVISTMPPAQAIEVLPKRFAHKDCLSQIKMLGCYSLMLGFDRAVDLGFDAALVKNADISWISVNSAKPDRSGPTTLLVHSTNLWAEQFMDLADGYVKRRLKTATSKVTGFDAYSACHTGLMRWRFANIGKQSGPMSFIDHKNKLVACGDWCIQGRIEAAYCSGIYTAQSILERLKEG